MGGYDGVVRIITKLDTSGFQTGTKQLQTQTNTLVRSISSKLGTISKMLISVFAVTQLVKFGKQAIELSSDLAEVDNVVGKAFGDMRGEMDEFANNAIKNLGMSRLTAYQTGSTFMSMGKSMLDSGEDAKNMALELTKLTGNMSSFFNVSHDVASVALKSIYTGETETLKQYGVVMSEVNLKQFALAEGITKAYGEMSQSEKVMLRYNYVMSQLGYIGDDFLDTQDSWANQTKILKEQWKEFMTIIGNGLVTVLTPVVKVLNNIVSSLISVGNTLSTVLTNVFGLKAQTIGAEQASDAYGDLADSVDEYGDAVESANKKAKNSLNSLDDLNNISSGSSSGDGSSSGSSGGISAFEGVTSEGASYLEQMLEKFQPLQDAIARLKESFEPLAKNIGDGLKWLYDNVLVPLGDWTIGEVLPAFLDILGGAIDVVNQAIEDLQPVWQWFWDNVLSPIAEFVGDAFVAMLNGVGDALEWISQNEFAMAVLEGIILAITGLAIAVGIVTGVMAIASGVATVLAGAIAFITSPVTIVIAIIGALIAVGILLYKNWDYIKWKADVIWGNIKGTIENVMNNIRTTISNVINNIKSVWNSVFESIKTTTQNVFNGIWSVIRNVINSILGGIQSMVNGIINGINTMIRAFNKLKWDIPDWVPALGGKTFGFNLSEVKSISIPRLANGGITTGSTLANIGEKGREAVLPLENNTQWMDDLAEKLAGKMQNSVTFKVEGDANGLFNVVRKQSNEYYKRTGVNAFA